MIRFIVILSILLFAVTQVAVANSFEGRVVVPRNVDPTALEIIVHETTFSDVENDRRGVAVPVSIAPNGEFSLSATSDTMTLTLEFTGPGVRRARFPWPEITADRAVFRLSPGHSMDVHFKDAKTGEPIPGVLIGPIIPGEEAERAEMDASYPFFVRADANGHANITGLASLRCTFPVYAEGYHRQVEHRTIGHVYTVELEPGGGAFEGRLIGSRTGRPYALTPVRLRGVESELHIIRKTDDEGKFSFGGLQAGPYGLAPVVVSYSDVREQEFIAVEGRTIRAVTLEVPEGIRVAGRVMDAEYERPIAGATVAVQGQAVESDEEGYFDFDAIDGPWPASFAAEHAEFAFSSDDQSLDHFPINGHRGEDITDVIVKLRRLRFLEITAEQKPAESAPFAPAALEVWGPIDAQPMEVQRERLTSDYQVYPLSKAGTRIALARTASGLVSDLHVVKTEQDATTTTVPMILSPGATLTGSLVYTEDEQPVENYRVLLAAPSPINTVWMTIRPDEAGKFTAAGLPPGEVEVRFMRPDDAPYLHETIQLVRGETVELNRSVGRGQPLSGIAMNEAEEPLRGITILAYGFDPQGLALNLRATSDDEGRFRFDGFGGPTVREIRVDHFEHAPYSKVGIPVPDEEFKLVLEPRAGIKVHVDAPQAALMTARVYLLQGNVRSDAMTPGQWYYTVDAQHSLAGESEITLSPLTTGDLQVAAETDGVWDVSAPFQWHATGETKEIRLAPGHRSSVSARVQGISGEELAALEVSLINTSLPEGTAETVFTPVAAPPDRLLFQNIPAGCYLLVASSQLGEFVSIPNIILAGGEQKDVEISFEKNLLDIAGKLTSDDGGVLTGRRITLHYGDIPEPEALAEDTTGSDGTFLFELLASGRPYLLQIEHNNGVRQITVDMLTESRHLDIVLASESSVKFLVPASLAQTIPARGHIPMYFSPMDGGGAGFTRRIAELQEPNPIIPGRYRIAWGEQVLGNVDIPSSRELVEIVLPDPSQ